MAMINVNRGATSLGIFSDEDVRAGLRTGRFAPTDLGWREGMTSWQPLAQFPEFASETAGAAAAQGAPTTAITSSQVATETPIVRTGLPWENRQERGFVNAFTETLVMVLTKPVEAFQIMRTEGGFGDPLLYALIGGSLGFIVYCLLTIALQSVGMFASRNNPFAAMFGAGIGMVFFIILAPLFVAVTVFIAAAVMHLCLMLVGGAKKSFETTFRVICFATGSAQPLLIIPFCGGLISGIWGIVVECIGLAHGHETDTGRAVLAVLLPVIVCCGGALVLGVMFGVMGALSAQH
jgi:hypothetical protein